MMLVGSPLADYQSLEGSPTWLAWAAWAWTIKIPAARIVAHRRIFRKAYAGDAYQLARKVSDIHTDI